jgi:hypothetical protein
MATEVSEGRVRLSYHTVARLEARPDVANPTWNTLEALAAALGVPVSAIWPPEPSGGADSPEAA